MGFSGQKYWRVLPFPSPGDFPDPGIELGSSALQAGSHQGIKELGMSVNESDKARNPIMKCESKI